MLFAFATSSFTYLFIYFAPVYLFIYFFIIVLLGWLFRTMSYFSRTLINQKWKKQSHVFFSVEVLSRLILPVCCPAHFLAFLREKIVLYSRWINLFLFFHYIFLLLVIRDLFFLLLLCTRPIQILTTSSRCVGLNLH